METKYHYNFWRPETAIPASDGDGNPRTSADSTFVPFIATCEAHESFKTCLLRAIRHYKRWRALEHRRSRPWR